MWGQRRRCRAYGRRSRADLRLDQFARGVAWMEEILENGDAM